MQNNKFHQNLMWELEYLNESEGNLQRKEKKAFTIQGNHFQLNINYKGK